MIENALEGTLIDEEVVECRPEKVSNAVLDEDVDVHLVRPYFSHDAWLIVEDVVKRKRELDVWTCNVTIPLMKEHLLFVNRA